MKKNVFSLIGFSMTGIGMGIPVTLICMTLIGGYNQIILEFLTWTIASALFGIISGLVFHVENDLNLPVAMLLHCAGCLLVATCATVICGYVSSFYVWLTAILPVFVVVYVLVYAFCIITMKIHEKQINQALDKG